MTKYVTDEDKTHLFLHLILPFQVEFGSLLSKGDLLYFYRPCLEENQAEEAIFGTNSIASTSSTTFDTIQDLYRCAADHLIDETTTQQQHRLHFLYGSSSTIVKIKQTTSSLHSQEQNSKDLYPIQIPFIINQGYGHGDGGQRKEKRAMSIFGHVISIEDNPLVRDSYP
jgi:hypothetical protein